MKQTQRGLPPKPRRSPQHKVSGSNRRADARFLLPKASRPVPSPFSRGRRPHPCPQRLSPPPAPWGEWSFHLPPGLRTTRPGRSQREWEREHPSAPGPCGRRSPLEPRRRRCRCGPGKVRGAPPGRATKEEHGGAGQCACAPRPGAAFRPEGARPVGRLSQADRPGSDPGAFPGTGLLGQAPRPHWLPTGVGGGLPSSTWLEDESGGFP